MSASAYVEEALRWLPARTPTSPPDLKDQNAHSAASRAGEEAAEPSRARVLLADDNADMRDYVERMLRTRYAVCDGSEALAAARRETPDLIVADVMMPVMDGFGLLREIRDDASLCTIPVLLLSARAGEEARVEGWDAGADDYLVKPFSAKELVARVATHLRMARLRRDAEQAVRQTDERFRALIKTTSAVVYCMSGDWTELRYLQGREFIADTLEPTLAWLDKYIDPQDRAWFRRSSPKPSTRRARSNSSIV
jgi:CheY-like chemotaxis protein